MTNLTKEKRELIIDSVINKGTKIPKQKEALKKRVIARVREICLSRVPKEFPAATKNLPATWFPHNAEESPNKDVNPLDLMSIGEVEAKRNRWYGTRVNFEPIKHPLDARFARPTYARENGATEDNPESWEALLAPEIAEAKKIWDTEQTARKQLASFLASVRTYKQVLEKMPELEGHLPDVPAKQYPVAAPIGPLVKMLTGLGFDQSAA